MREVEHVSWRVWMLLGGDKSSQTRDIRRAIKMARKLEERA